MGIIQKAINESIKTATVVKAAKEAKELATAKEIGDLESKASTLTEQAGVRQKELSSNQSRYANLELDRKDIYRNKGSMGRAEYSQALRKISNQRRALRESMQVIKESQNMKKEQLAMINERISTLKGAK